MLSAVAVAVAVWYGMRRMRAAGLPEETFGDIVLWAIIGGVIGARLFHVLDHIPYYLEHPLQAISLWEGGLAVYGAFAGGVAGAIIVVWRAKLSVWGLLDAGAPAMLVGQAIGRVGCFINGDAWGAPTGSNWGVVYSNPGDLLPSDLLGVPTHPYPLYEIAGVILLLEALLIFRDRLTSPGRMFLVSMLGYAAVRFILTFFRQETIVFAGMQEAQVIALLTAIAALAGLLWTSLRASAVAAAA